MPRIEKVCAALLISTASGLPLTDRLSHEYGTPNSAMPAIMVTKSAAVLRDHVERPPISRNTALFV